MSFNTGIGTRLLAWVALAWFIGLSADAAMAQSVRGTATYKERMALPAAAVFEATLEDVSRADAPAETIPRTRVASPGNPPGLTGTSWQLVKFQGSDDTTLAPDDRAKYTIQFGTGGQLTTRIDGNQGRGSWKSTSANQLQVGPLALTRAKCPAGSLHDQIVKHWGYIRSYVIKDGHLFLSLMADGGIYEFEPVKKNER